LKKKKEAAIFPI